MLLLTDDVVPLKVRRNVIGDDVFHRLAGYAGERDWAIVECCIPLAFFEDWSDVRLIWGHMSKSVYVRVVHDLELLSYFFVVRSNDSFNFPLRLIKYIVIIVIFQSSGSVRQCSTVVGVSVE